MALSMRKKIKRTLNRTRAHTNTLTYTHTRGGNSVTQCCQRVQKFVRRACTEKSPSSSVHDCCPLFRHCVRLPDCRLARCCGLGRVRLVFSVSPCLRFVASNTTASFARDVYRVAAGKTARYSDAVRKRKLTSNQWGRRHVRKYFFGDTPNEYVL